jgi:hypothetical protein
MNLWWEIFGIDDSALDGWIVNGARLLTVTIAILLAIYKDPTAANCCGSSHAQSIASPAALNRCC